MAPPTVSLRLLENLMPVKEYHRCHFLFQLWLFILLFETEWALTFDGCLF